MLNEFEAHQGDVYIRSVSSIPDSAIEITPKNDRIVLAYGEVTGHAHAIEAKSVQSGRVTFWSAGAERFLRVLSTVILTHEEHGPIVLAPGNYTVGGDGKHVQREYTPEQIRRVVD